MEHLPSETLSSIFGHTLPDYRCDFRDDSYLNHASRTRAIACSLALVCRFWRDVANVTPDLWSFIDINIGLDVPPEVTQKRLEKAHGGPLDIIILLEYTDDPRHVFIKGLTTANTYHKQWRSLLVAQVSPGLLLRSKHLPRYLPRLERASFDRSIVQSDDSPTFSAPALRNLIVAGDFLAFTDCSQLAHVTLQSPDDEAWRDFARFCATCPTLKTLELRNFNSKTLPDHSGEAATLRSDGLREIRILECVETVVTRILEHIVSQSVEVIQVGSFIQGFRPSSSKADIAHSLPGVKVIRLSVSASGVELRYINRMVQAMPAGIAMDMKVQIVEWEAQRTLSAQRARLEDLKLLRQRCTVESRSRNLVQ